MRVIRLACLRVLRGELERGAGGPPEDDRHRELALGHVVHLRRRVDDLVDGQEGEVEGHELDDGPQPRHRRAHAQPREAELADRRVHDALVAELVEQALGHLVGAVVLGDLLAHEEDVRVPLHLLAERLVEGLAVGHHGHQRSLPSKKSRPFGLTSAQTLRYSASGPGTGDVSAKSAASWEI